MTKKSPSFLYSFSRSQVAAAAATLIDYGTILLCTEYFKLWYLIGTGLGAFFGAIANFLINRHWAFQAGHLNWNRQARRYALVSICSLILNMIGTYLCTEFARLHYMLSVLIVSTFVGFLFNYPLYRKYVYI